MYVSHVGWKGRLFRHRPKLIQDVSWARLHTLSVFQATGHVMDVVLQNSFRKGNLSHQDPVQLRVLMTCLWEKWSRPEGQTSLQGTPAKPDWKQDWVPTTVRQRPGSHDLLGAPVQIALLNILATGNLRVPVKMASFRSPTKLSARVPTNALGHNVPREEVSMTLGSSGISRHLIRSKHVRKSPKPGML